MSSAAAPAFRIAVLASGRGTNLQALIDAIAAGQLAATLVGVWSDRTDAGALARAQHAGIAHAALRPADYPSRAAFDQALFEQIDACRPDLVVCAGYMRLLDADVVQARAGRLINIHPSLLPAFKGLHTHRQALAAGVTTHGASIHYVSAQLDGGPVIAQAAVPILPGDDEATLAARVLAREHPLLCQSVQAIASGRVRLVDNRVMRDGQPMAAPLQLAANNRFA